MTMRLFVAILATGATISSASSLYRREKCMASDFLTVGTTSGEILGHLVDGAPCLVEYLGIPYAQPPVSSLRFQPAKQLQASKRTVFVADSFSPKCIQSPSKDLSAFPGLTPQALQVLDEFTADDGLPQSEDCLTLNIWAQTTQASLKNTKPVLVHMYGGRLSGGSTDNAFYNGINLATAEDLIVVTINYRLNIFGFPGMPSMAQPNLGLLDVRLALEWVRDNIANFGGDNNKIVFSGQSSGAAWADQMIYAFADDPIFSGIISASGTALSFSPLPPTTAAANWETVVGVVGCSSTNQTAVLQCMQSVDTDTLEAAAGAVKGLSTSNVLRSTPAFYLVVDNATIFTAAGYAAMNANGDFAQVPSLLTHNNFEAGFYQVQLFAVTGTLPTQDQLTSFQLSTFTCADSVQAQARRQHNVPTWVYRYFGDWSNTRLYNTSGAYHGSDMEEIFGNSGNVSGIAPIAPQLSLGSIMQEAWGAFCADPVNGLTEQLGWPVYNEDKATMVLLGQNDQPEFTFVPPSTFDSPCSTVTLGISATATAT